MMGVAGDAVTADFRVDLGAPGLGVLVLLQHQRSGALAHDKAVAAGVKGDTGRSGILGGGKGLQLEKPATPMGIMAASAPPESTASR